MVRIEHMDFLLPMKIGEVAELTAEIIYTSPHSLLVEIKVHGENIITGIKFYSLFYLFLFFILNHCKSLAH
jgi:acyl-coenzyme A thioesterase 7